jgi:hypothetical protein
LLARYLLAFGPSMLKLDAVIQAIPWELMSPNRPICRALSHMHCVNALEAMRLRQRSSSQAGTKSSAAASAGLSADVGGLQPMFFMVFSSATTDVSELQVTVAIDAWSNSTLNFFLSESPSSTPIFCAVCTTATRRPSQ